MERIEGKNGKMKERNKGNDIRKWWKGKKGIMERIEKNNEKTRKEY